MIFRETTLEDVEFAGNHSISRGISKRQPEKIEYLYTLEHHEVPLGIGGFHLINLTTAWCWVDLMDTAGEHMIVAYRVIKEWIDIFAKEHNLKRLQAYVQMDFPEAIRMVQHLGFEKESIMKNFVGDKDALLYVRVL